MPSWFQELDRSLLLWIHQGWRAPWADRFFIWITDADHFLIPLAVAWILLMIFGGRVGRVLGLLLAVTLVLTDQVASQWLKPWVGRTRPCFEVEGVEALIAQVNSRSFPSSHAANAFGAATVLALVRGGWFRLAYLIAACVALSRIYVGVHWPSDAVGGALLGFGLGWLVWMIAEMLGLLGRPGHLTAGGGRIRDSQRRSARMRRRSAS